MRTIKFRGKRIDDGEWVYGDLCNYRGDVYIKEDETCWDIQLCDKVDPSTVGQFIGIQLKSWVLMPQELYEGDIITSGRDAMAMTYSFDELGFVAQAEEGTSLYREDVMINEGMYHIVGNVHDNPELME